MRAARRGVVVMAMAMAARSPVRLGAALEPTACIERCGRSSMTVPFPGRAETLARGATRQALDARFGMLALDAHGRPRRHTTFKEPR